jgi:hypothetical protein
MTATLLALLAAGCGSDACEEAAICADVAADATAAADALTQTGTDAGAVTDGGTHSDAGAADDQSLVVSCGEDTCPRESQVCCFTGYPGLTTTCTASDSCGELVAACDGPEDCSDGDICCGDQSGAACKKASECTGFTAAQLCHTSADCPETNNCHDSDFVAWPIC